MSNLCSRQPIRETRGTGRIAVAPTHFHVLDGRSPEPIPPQNAITSSSDGIFSTNVAEARHMRRDRKQGRKFHGFIWIKRSPNAYVC
jgi:hypothetical protein